MERKNKNITCSRIRLLKLDYKDKKSWNDILGRIVTLANVFMNCLILLQKQEVHVFAFTSVQLFATLQEVSSRKYFNLNDANNMYNIYGSNHTFAIVWTVKGDARMIPECLETKHLFKEISNELQEVSKSQAVVSVQFGSLVSENFIFKTELQAARAHQVCQVNFVKEITYKNDFFIANKRVSGRHKQGCAQLEGKYISLSKISKKVVPSNNNVLLEISPYTGNQYHNREAHPQQVSGEQESAGRSEIAFSNGASLIPLDSNLYGFRSSSSQTQTPSVASARPSIPAKYPDYCIFSDRLKTYARWTHRKPDPNQLSEVGFFFTDQEEDLVRCFQCGIGLKDFSSDDNPLMEHVRNSSRCPFLLEYLGQSQLSSILDHLQTQDPELNRRRQLELSKRTRPEVNYTIRHPEYQTFESRLLTYDKWPRQVIQTPRQLADAGLYYTGFEDHVRCFACDGGLRRWDPEDDPWTEHCRWFPACPFARHQKGDEYIALVQASAEYGNEDNGEELTHALEQMTLRDPVYNAALNEHKDACLEMGYQLTDFNETVQEIRSRGTVMPTIDEILDTIEVIKERKRRAAELEKKQNETPTEENQRLKCLIICMSCGRDNVNALFLPCAHHRLCMKCAEPLTKCPVCDRHIRQKIRTYLA